MKHSGLSWTFGICWIVTLAALLFTFLVLGESAKGPANVCAANVLIVTSMSLLFLVPVILLSLLCNTRRTCCILEEMLEQQRLKVEEEKPSTVIR
jgi:hypothetical protein